MDRSYRLRSAGSDVCAGAEVVVFQFGFEQTGKAALGGSVEFAGGYAWDQCGHGVALDFMENENASPRMIFALFLCQRRRGAPPAAR